MNILSKSGSGVFGCFVAAIVFCACNNDAAKNFSPKFCVDYKPSHPKLLKTDSSLFNTKAASQRAYTLQPGTTLNVYFYQSNDDIHQKVLETAAEWSKHCSITFRKTDQIRFSDIRVSFRHKGYWSAVGSSGYDHEVTMSLDSIDFLEDPVEFRRVILHEFGHALGLVHEHQSPNSHIKWNESAVYAYYKQPPNEWSEKMVQENVFAKYDKTITNYTTYDPLSIMQYPIPGGLTLDGFTVGWNSELSETDKQFINHTYPK